MYVPAAFAEERVDVLQEFMAKHDFVTLMSCKDEQPTASHVPVVVLPDRGTYGSIQFHLARQNPDWESLADGKVALAIFHGPHGYISPRWYQQPISVPTWNYVAVHATGRPRMLDEAELSGHLDALVAKYESGQWDARRLPPDVSAKLRAQVVGFEMVIETLQGKWKLGQNRTQVDREGAIAGLRSTGSAEDATLADWMAATLAR